MVASVARIAAGTGYVPPGELPEDEDTASEAAAKESTSKLSRANILGSLQLSTPSDKVLMLDMELHLECLDTLLPLACM